MCISKLNASPKCNSKMLQKLVTDFRIQYFFISANSKIKSVLRPGMTVVSIELRVKLKSYNICHQTDTQKEKNMIVGDFNSRQTAYKMGLCFTETSVSTTALRQKTWKQGLLYSTTGSLESGMKEMNTAANHSSLFTGSFSKPLLCLSALWRRGRKLVRRHALVSSEYVDGFTHFLTLVWELGIFAASKKNYPKLTYLPDWVRKLSHC